MSVASERVLVVPTSVFHQLGYFQGFCSNVGPYLEELFHPRHTSYRPRGEMERDPSFKQLIPYLIFRHTDDAGRVSIFQYTRGRGQGEQRLHSKQSVGIGGHISSEDDGVDGQATYQEGMRRELAEEVSLDTEYQQRCVGLINDDLTEVGKVHLGVVHLFDVARPAVTPRETEIMDAGFRPLDELLGRLDRMESWSRICLEALFAK